MSSLPLESVPTMNTKADAGVVATSVQTKVPKLSADVIHLIIQAVDNPTYGWYEFINQLKSCALVSRDWRTSAQQSLHRVVRFTENNYKPTLGHYSANASAVDKHANLVNGDIWRFPRVLLFESLPPAPFSSWLEVPELQDFAERCAERIKRIDLTRDKYDSSDVVACISRFPSMKRLDLRDITWTRIPSAPANPAALRYLQQVNLGHEACRCPPSTDSICALEAFAAWLRGTERGDLLRVSLKHNFRIHHKKNSFCNLPRELAGTLRDLYLSGRTLWRDDDDEDDIPCNLLRFPDLTCCNRLESITLNSRQMLELEGYATAILSSITSPVLTSIRVTFNFAIGRSANMIMQLFLGLIGMGKLLSCQKKFPALEHVTLSVWYSDTAFEKEVAEALLSEEFECLREKRNIDVKYDFYRSIVYYNTST